MSINIRTEGRKNTIVKSNRYNHIYRIDLHNNGILEECAVLKEDRNGNIHFIPLKSLDRIDLNRLSRIITGRHSDKYPLWELMADTRLGNGINALTYFHQLVKTLTYSGMITDPNRGVGYRQVFQPQFNESPPRQGVIQDNTQTDTPAAPKAPAKPKATAKPKAPAKPKATAKK